jgi:hypothetical protein
MTAAIINGTCSGHHKIETVLNMEENCRPVSREQFPLAEQIERSVCTI